jgi:hypothetical protein
MPEFLMQYSQQGNPWHLTLRIRAYEAKVNIYPGWPLIFINWTSHLTIRIQDPHPPSLCISSRPSYEIRNRSVCSPHS